VAVQIRVSQKAKWKYVFKTAMLWAFGISTFIYLFQWVTGQVTEEFSISLALMSTLIGIVAGAIVLLPIGIMAGLLFWRRR
jgi:ABC-type phosphate transport system permease subunit